MPSTQQTVREWSRLQGYAWGIAGNLSLITCVVVTKF